MRNTGHNTGHNKADHKNLGHKNTGHKNTRHKNTEHSNTEHNHADFNDAGHISTPATAPTPIDELPQPVHITSGNSVTPLGRRNQPPKTVANGSRALVWYLLSLVMLILDQWTKWLAETRLTFHDPVPVIEPFLNWTLAYNYGAAFSFLSDAGGWQKWLFAGLAVLISLSLIVYLIKAPRSAKLLSTGLALVLGGAIGNLIDRVRIGKVVDFIHVHYADVWHYPIFNIADMAICVGVALILIDMLFFEKHRTATPATTR